MNSPTAKKTLSFTFCQTCLTPKSFVLNHKNNLGSAFPRHLPHTPEDPLKHTRKTLSSSFCKGCLTHQRTYWSSIFFYSFSFCKTYLTHQRTPSSTGFFLSFSSCQIYLTPGPQPQIPQKFLLDQPPEDLQILGFGAATSATAPPRRICRF